MIRRDVRLVRRMGDSMPYRHQWGCCIDPGPDGLDVRIAAPGGAPGTDLEEPAARLHDALLRQIPSVLRNSARSEVGVVRTESRLAGRRVEAWQTSYALVTCADVVVTLAEDLWPRPAAPWQGTCSPTDLDRDLPVVLGPSAVLSLAGGTLEMPDDPARPEAEQAALPSWMSVRSVRRSPYPPHDCPPQVVSDGAPTADGLPAAITWWATRTEHWMRPMRTARASRGQYSVLAALPTMRGRSPAIWVESLVSLDTSGQCWHASLSIERDGGRWWLAQPFSVEIRANDVLSSVVGQIEPSRPALDRDPVDGESFGWAPALLTGITGSELSARRQPT